MPMTEPPESESEANLEPELGLFKLQRSTFSHGVTDANNLKDAATA